VLGLVSRISVPKLLVALKPAGINRGRHLSQSVSVVFTMLVSIAAGVFFLDCSRLLAARTDVNALLNQKPAACIRPPARGEYDECSSSRSRSRVFAARGAAFMMKSLFAVLKVDPGFAQTIAYDEVQHAGIALRERTRRSPVLPPGLRQSLGAPQR